MALPFPRPLFFLLLLLWLVPSTTAGQNHPPLMLSTPPHTDNRRQRAHPWHSRATPLRLRAACIHVCTCKPILRTIKRAGWCNFQGSGFNSLLKPPPLPFGFGLPRFVCLSHCTIGTPPFANLHQPMWPRAGQYLHALLPHSPG